MKQSRPLNIILMIVSLALLIALPVRNLLFPGDPAADVAASGGVVFDPDQVNEGAALATWVMLFLFGSLTLVFGWRAFGPTKSDEA